MAMVINPKNSQQLLSYPDLILNCYIIKTKNVLEDWLEGSGNAMHQSKKKNVNQIEVLLTRYGFEVKQRTIPELVEVWLAFYSLYWIRLAIVEALYQGRYKAISVEHILALWKRLGHPTYHFTYEFERFITGNLFLDDLLKEHIVEDQPLPKEQVTIEKSLENVPKNTISLTPIQELVKKIAIPVSIPSEKLSINTEQRDFISDPVAEDLEIKENGKHTRNLESDLINTQQATVFHQENNSRSIDQFIPHCEPSDFYGKLRAVAHKQFIDVEQ